jgi:hypothetical protein
VFGYEDSVIHISHLVHVTKLLADVQKSYCNPTCEDDGEKVHIPDTFEDSESDSDSFGLKVQMLTRFGDAGQSSSK